MPTPFRQDTVSKFVAASVKQISLPPGALILDIPCGFGRHARWLASNNHIVVGLDIDAKRISEARHFAQFEAAQMLWCVADAGRPLPVKDGSFNAVVAVHYVSDHVIEMARRALKPGGHLIFETFDARGGNWQDLPLIGAIPSALTYGFETVRLYERAVGPENSRAVVRALARRSPLLAKNN